MINLIDLEKKINSELTTKIKKTEIKHEQLYMRQFLRRRCLLCKLNS